MTLPVPPVVDTLGAIEAKLPDIAARVAENLHITSESEDVDVWVASAVDAAVGYVIGATNRSSVGLPDDALTVNGLVGFSTRIYQDGFSPNGVQLAIVDPTFEPIFQPEHLYKHWRHYFARLQMRWGIA